MVQQRGIARTHIRQLALQCTFSHIAHPCNALDAQIILQYIAMKHLLQRADKVV